MSDQTETEGTVSLQDKAEQNHARYVGTSELITHRALLELHRLISAASAPADSQGKTLVRLITAFHNRRITSAASRAAFFGLVAEFLHLLSGSMVSAVDVLRVGVRTFQREVCNIAITRYTPGRDRTGAERQPITYVSDGSRQIFATAPLDKAYPPFLELSSTLSPSSAYTACICYSTWPIRCFLGDT